MITYSTNWMSPISLDWYRDRGLTRQVSKVLTEDQKFGNLKAGDTWTYEEIITEYACGRIDIRGLDSEKYWSGRHEYSLPAMQSEDWNALSEWLVGLETTELLEFDDIIAQYEQQSERKIRWYKDDHLEEQEGE